MIANANAGLIGLYEFESDFTDSSPAGNDGTVGGGPAPSLIPGFEGNSVDLNGTGSGGPVQGAYIITIGQNTSYNMWIFADQDSWESRNGEWEHVINSLTPDIQ